MSSFALLLLLSLSSFFCLFSHFHQFLPRLSPPLLSLLLSPHLFLPLFPLLPPLSRLLPPLIPFGFLSLPLPSLPSFHSFNPRTRPSPLFLFPLVISLSFHLRSFLSLISSL